MAAGVEEESEDLQGEVALVVEGVGRQVGRIWEGVERVGGGQDCEVVDRGAGEKIDMCEEEGERVVEGVRGK